jgi:hypothetical protein
MPAVRKSLHFNNSEYQQIVASLTQLVQIRQLDQRVKYANLSKLKVKGYKGDTKPALPI